MRRLTAFVAIAALTGASACQRSEPEQPTAPVEPQAEQAAATGPAVGYACESGTTIEARYPDTDTAALTYQNRDYAMQAVPAASGARYVGAGVEWWTATRDGQESGTLSRLGPDGKEAVAVLERCARPIPVGGVTGPQPIPGQTPTPAPGGVLPASAPCKGPQLKLSSEGGDAGMGNRVGVIGVQNIGAQACALTGYPTVTLQDGQGRTLSSIRAEQNPGSYFRQGQAPTPVNVAPGAKAYFDLAWNVMPHEGEGEKTCPTAARVRMTAPSDTAAVTLAQEFTPCGGRIQVSPFRDEKGPTA